jgi:hypothetical protein
VVDVADEVVEEEEAEVEEGEQVRDAAPEPATPEPDSDSDGDTTGQQQEELMRKQAQMQENARLTAKRAIEEQEREDAIKKNARQGLSKLGAMRATLNADRVVGTKSFLEKSRLAEEEEEEEEKRERKRKRAIEKQEQEDARMAAAYQREETEARLKQDADDEEKKLRDREEKRLRKQQEKRERKRAAQQEKHEGLRAALALARATAAASKKGWGSKKLPWTIPEEDALIAGVEQYGRGNWADILNDVRLGLVLANRDNISLKDKWRNITK